MSNGLSTYISRFVKAVKHQQGKELKACITINPGGQEGPERASYPEPNDFDLYQVPEKFRDVLKFHLRLMRAVYIEKSIEQAFVELDAMVNHLIRAGNTQTNWINKPLINSMYELITVYKVREQKHPEETAQPEFQDLDDGDSFGQGDRKESPLEKLTNTANKAFKLSLNDKNLELHLSKRTDIYFFLAVLIKLYFKLNKLQLAKSLDTALKGTMFQLPDMKSSASNKRSGITYLYYSSLLSLDESDFKASEEKLERALDILQFYGAKNKQSLQILLILLPLKLYNSRAIPKSTFWAEYPLLKTIYHDNIFKAVLSGDLALFDEKVQQYQTIFLKNHLYLLIEYLRQECYLSLIYKTTSIYREVAQPAEPARIPTSALQRAFDVSKQTSGTSQDEIECIVANLIYADKVRGYISNGMKMIVLSKKIPFPGVTQKNRAT